MKNKIETEDVFLANSFKAIADKFIGSLDKEQQIERIKQFILSQFSIKFNEKAGNIEVSFPGIFCPKPHFGAVFNINLEDGSVELIVK